MFNKINKETVKTVYISITIGAMLGAYGMHWVADSTNKTVQAAIKAVPVAQAASPK